MICKKCGNPIKEGAKFCNNCGYDLSNEQFDINVSDENVQSITLKKEDENRDNDKFTSSNKNQDNRQYNSNMNQQDQQQKKKKTSKIIIGVIVTIAIIVGLSALASSGDYSEEVRSVKNGYFQDYSYDDGYPDVGDAFENYFGDTSWEAFTSDDDMEIVEFNGKFMYYDDETDCCLQFQTYEDGSFDIYAVEFNGIPQDKLTISVLLEKVMDEAQYMDGND